MRNLLLAALLFCPALAAAQSSDDGDAAFGQALGRIQALDAETPVASFVLADMQRRQDASGLPVVLGENTYKLTLSFAKDYTQFLTVQAGAAKTVLPWDVLSQGAQAGDITVALKDGVLSLCPASGSCAVLSVSALLDWAYNEQGKALDLRWVRYSLLLDPAQSYVGMLRRDQDGQYFVGVYALSDLRAAPGWFVGLNNVLFGLRFDGTLLDVVREPAPPSALSLQPIQPFRRVNAGS